MDGGVNSDSTDSDERNFEFGKNGKTIWPDKPIHPKFARIPVINGPKIFNSS